MGWLQKIREKPESERNMIAIGVALAIAIIIAIFWLISLSGRFKQSRESTPDTAKPFSVLENIFSKGVADVRNDQSDSVFPPENTEGESYDLSGKSFQDLLNEFELPLEETSTEDSSSGEEGALDEQASLEEETSPAIIDGVEVLEVPAEEGISGSGTSSQN